MGIDWKKWGQSLWAFSEHPAVAPLVTILIVVVAGFVFRNSLKTALVTVWGFLIYPVPVPVSLLGILILAVAVSLGAWGRIWWVRRRQPPWFAYKQDEFFGMIWRWEWLPNRSIKHLCCFCPQDDTALVDFPLCRELHRCSVGFRCETCGKRFGPIVGENRAAVLRVIQRQIHRKKRSREWKGVVIGTGELKA